MAAYEAAYEAADEAAYEAAYEAEDLGLNIRPTSKLLVFGRFQVYLRDSFLSFLLRGRTCGFSGEAGLG